MLSFWEPFGFNVFQGRSAVKAKSQNGDIGVFVRQRPQSVVVFLSGRVPKSEVDRSSVNHHVGGVVVEHGRDVLAREGIGRVADQKASFT